VFGKKLKLCFTSVCAIIDYAINGFVINHQKGLKMTTNETPTPEIPKVESEKPAAA